MTTEHDPGSGSTEAPVVDLDPETYPTVDDVPGSVVDEALDEPSDAPGGGSAGPESLPGVGDIDPEAPLPERAPGEDVQADDQVGSSDDVVPSDKDLLRGGSGEQGDPSHPATDEDLLRGGSGWSEPSEER
jgi:hypothetical protein